MFTLKHVAAGAVTLALTASAAMAEKIYDFFHEKG